MNPYYTANTIFVVLAMMIMLAAVSFNTTLGAEQKGSDESKKDVHEKDTEYLARSRRAAEYCAAHLGWAVVHCTSGDNMRSIEDIQAEVQKIVLKN